MRNPVRTGDSCAAVSGYKVSSQESEYSFDVALIRIAQGRAMRKNFFAKKEE
jgi:hypothetical protein